MGFGGCVGLAFVFLCCFFFFFFFNDTATTEIYTLSLHDALPISSTLLVDQACRYRSNSCAFWPSRVVRSEEHTSELQSRQYLVCRLLLEKKKKNQRTQSSQKTKKQKSIN